MQNINNWKPSKFVYRRGKLTTSKDPHEVIMESRFGVKIVAAFYDEYLRKYAKGRLLDLGCGKVPLYEAYKDYIDENICVDWAGTFHKNPYLDLEHDINEKLPFEDEVFDTILLSDVLEHIKSPHLLWNEMNRVLKKEGILIMNVPFFYWLHEVPYDYYRFTEFALKRYASENNFEILLLKPIGGIIEVMTDLFAKILPRIPFFGKVMSVLIQSFSSFIVNTKWGQKRTSNTGKSFPYGYFLIAKKF